MIVLGFEKTWVSLLRGVSKDLLLNNECIKNLSLSRNLIKYWSVWNYRRASSELNAVLFNPCEDLSVCNNMVYFIYYPVNCFNLAIS